MIISPPVAPQTRESHRLAESDEAVIIPPEHGDAGIDTVQQILAGTIWLFQTEIDALQPCGTPDRPTGFRPLQMTGDQRT